MCKQQLHSHWQPERRRPEEECYAKSGAGAGRSCGLLAGQTRSTDAGWRRVQHLAPMAGPWEEAGAAGVHDRQGLVLPARRGSGLRDAQCKFDSCLASQKAWMLSI